MIAQFCIGLFGLTAMALSMFGSARARRWAPFVGLLGQLFWFYFSFAAQAWGVLALSCAYALVYLHRIRLDWKAAAHV